MSFRLNLKVNDIQIFQDTVDGGVSPPSVSVVGSGGEDAACVMIFWSTNIWTSWASITGNSKWWKK